MAFEHVAKSLAETHAVKLTVKVTPPIGRSQARLDLVMKDKAGKLLQGNFLGARPTVDGWRETVSELIQFLLDRGFQIVSQNDGITELERALTEADHLSLPQRLDQLFAESLPTKIRVNQSASLYDLVVNAQIVKLGNLEENDRQALQQWLESHGFVKVKEVTEDFRFGEFSHYYERPEAERK